jgi:hypothetical protein
MAIMALLVHEHEEKQSKIFTIFYVCKIAKKNYVKLAKIAQPWTKSGRCWMHNHPQTGMVIRPI